MQSCQRIPGPYFIRFQVEYCNLHNHGTNSYIPATRPNDNVCRDNEEGDSYAPAPLPVFSPLNGSRPRKSYPVTRPIATNGNTPRPHPSPNTSTNSSPSAHHSHLYWDQPQNSWTPTEPLKHTRRRRRPNPSLDDTALNRLVIPQANTNDALKS